MFILFFINIYYKIYIIIIKYLLPLLFIFYYLSYFIFNNEYRKIKLIFRFCKRKIRSFLLW